jgi:hypothetical protein
MKKIARRASILVTAAVVVCATAASAFAQDASSRCAPREISRSELLALDLESLLDIKVVTRCFRRASRTRLASSRLSVRTNCAASVARR